MKSAFYGLRPCSTGLIAAAGVSVVMVSLFTLEKFKSRGRLSDLFNFGGLLLAVVIWILTNRVKAAKKLHPIVYIAASAVIGIVFSFGGV